MRDQDIFNSIKAVYSRISHAAMRAGRDPRDVKLIAVTKTVETDAIVMAAEAGLRDFGESRVQEAQKKVKSEELRVRGEDITWHLIGHLQKNKAKTAVELFDLIHSVDSLGLAEALNRHAINVGKVQRVFVEVKLSDEETKYGISRDGLLRVLERTAKLENLKVGGLMTIPPFFDDPERARPYFRVLRELRDEMEKAGFRLPGLSMGMSNDFEIAIEEGATMVRVGTAIFGERERRKE